MSLQNRKSIPNILTVQAIGGPWGLYRRADEDLQANEPQTPAVPRVGLEDWLPLRASPKMILKGPESLAFVFKNAIATKPCLGKSAAAQIWGGVFAKAGDEAQLQSAFLNTL